MGVSASAAGTQPPDGPPTSTALNGVPSGVPPPMSSTTSRMVMPMGTSMRPPRATLPASAKTLVPLLVALPMAAKASPPWRRIHGTLA